MGRFTELRRIDLSDNTLTSIPSDLTSLSKVVEFDLNGNPIEDVISTVDALIGMPNLRSLRINLHEED